jgi:hypothetical protein
MSLSRNPAFILAHQFATEKLTKYQSVLKARSKGAKAHSKVALAKASTGRKMKKAA